MSGVSAFLWQAALMLLVAYFLGAWIGCWLRRSFAAAPKVAMEANAGTTSGAGAATVRAAPDKSNRFSRALEGGDTIPVAARREPVNTAPTPSKEPAKPATESPEPRTISAAPPPLRATTASPTPPTTTAAPTRPPPKLRQNDAARPQTLSTLTPPMAAAAAAATLAAQRHAAAPVNKPEPATAPEAPPPPPSSSPASVAAKLESLDKKSTNPARSAAPPNLPTATGSTGAANVAAPVAVTAPAPTTSTVAPAARSIAAQSDDLTQIEGITPDDSAVLNQSDVTTFAAIASWTAQDVSRMNTAIGGNHRISRENWIEQAQLLSQNGATAFTRRAQAGLAPRPPVVATASRVAEAAAMATAAAVAAAATAPRVAERAAFRIPSPNRTEASAAPPPIHAATPTGAVTKTATQHAASTTVAATKAPSSTIAAVTSAAPNTPIGNVTPRDAPAANQDEARLRSAPSMTPIGSNSSAKRAVDDLKRIRGVGVLIEKHLRAMGYGSYQQIGSWTQADIDRVSQQLDFRGRIERENWIEQARILEAGGQTEFSRRFARGDDN